MFGKEHTSNSLTLDTVFPKDQPNGKITKIIYKIYFSVLVDYFHKYLYAI